MAAPLRILKLRSRIDEIHHHTASEGYVLVECDTIDELLSAVSSELTTVVLAEGALVADGHAAFLERIKTISPTAEGILVEDRPPVPKVVDAMLCGYVDVLERPLDKGLLDRAIDRARANAESERRIMRLSTRELDVLRLLANGLANKNVATRLGISHRTVEVYRARIMDKLSVSSFAALLSIVLKSRHVFPREIDGMPSQ